jgi:NADH dehydrogenase
MIFVTGGTGFVGQEVVRELLGLGYRVRLLVRDPRCAAALANHPQVELFQGDALCPETLVGAMAGVKAVIHLIGIIAETSAVSFELGHVEATRHVLAAAKAADVTRWMQMSAAGTRPEASSRYHRTKWEAEELVRQSGLDWTIFRPSLIYGSDERDRLFNVLRLALTWPPLYSFPLLDGGTPLVQPVSVREVARCFALAVSKEASLGRTYDLVGPVPFSWREMVFKIARGLGKSVVYEEVPILLLLRTVLWLAAVLLPILVITGVALGQLGLAHAELILGLWSLLAVTAWRWRELILFNVPGEPFRLASEALNAFVPRWLQCSEQLKMAAEDNIGDPAPAMETFNYTPENFEEGLKRLTIISE